MRQLALLLGIAAGLNAQAPSPLEQHLQGRQAKVLLDMPGDDSGVDVRPREAAVVNEQANRERLAKYGAALRQGQSVSVTLVKLKGDYIEFHLNGGAKTSLSAGNKIFNVRKKHGLFAGGFRIGEI